MRIKSSLAWALGLAVLISALAAAYPPKPKYPYLQIQAPLEATKLTILLAEKPNLSECQQIIATLQEAYLKVCPTCSFAQTNCLRSLGDSFQKLAANEPLQHYSIRFLGGDILIRAVSVDQVALICADLAQRGAGVCYPPLTDRPAAQSNQNSFNSTMLSQKIGHLRTIENGLLPSAVVFALSLLLSVLIVVTQRWHGAFTFDQSSGIQKFHSTDVPRVGGLPIFLALLMAAALGTRLVEFSVSELLWPVLLASIPALVFGFAEDITKRVGARERLLATMASAVLGWWLLGIRIDHVDVPWIDRALFYLPFSIALTAVAVSGIANSVNIIDGFHGLASGTVAIALAAIAAVALQVGDIQLAIISAMVIAAIAGFFLVNYPGGKLFLGDGGAYFLGFLLGWIGVMLPMRNPDVSAWTSLLICGYPVSETLFSMARRLRVKLHVGQPDRDHLHSLIKIAVIRPVFSQKFSLNTRNAMVAPPLWFFAALPAVAAFWAYGDTALLAAMFFGYCVLYGLIYWSLKAKSGHLPRQH